MRNNFFSSLGLNLYGSEKKQDINIFSRTLFVLLVPFPNISLQQDGTQVKYACKLEILKKKNEQISSFLIRKVNNFIKYLWRVASKRNVHLCPCSPLKVVRVSCGRLITTVLGSKACAKQVALHRNNVFFGTSFSCSLFYTPFAWLLTSVSELKWQRK